MAFTSIYILIKVFETIEASKVKKSQQKVQ